ncbi:ABC transporter ATP-binding protein, partial [Streptomyces sp. NPDC057092]
MTPFTTLTGTAAARQAPWAAQAAPPLPRDADGTQSVTHAARIEHVSKSFAGPAGQQLVLDDITLDVAPGEFVTLLGASGCGKS